MYSHLLYPMIFHDEAWLSMIKPFLTMLLVIDPYKLVIWEIKSH